MDNLSHAQHAKPAMKPNPVNAPTVDLLLQEPKRRNQPSLDSKF